MMLINGTSGYADYVAEDAIVPLLYADPFRAWQPDELIALALKKSMACDPGTCWSYAHTNFVILGKVLEKASGRPLQDLIREGILEPLSLRRHHDLERCRYPEERGCNWRGSAGFAAIARGPASAGDREIQAMECERLLRLGRLRRQWLDYPEPVLCRICRDHGISSRTEARDRRVRDLERKGIDKRQSLDRC